MLKKASFICLAVMTASCTVTYSDGRHAASKPVYKKKLKINTARDIAYGSLPTIDELAKQRSITGRGGIKQGAVVVLPSKAHIDALERMSHTYRPLLYIKPIMRGDTIAQANQYTPLGKSVLPRDDIPTITLPVNSSQNQCNVIIDNMGAPVVIRDHETGIHKYAFRHVINDAYAQYNAHQAELMRLKADLKAYEAKRNSLKSSLANNRANQKGQCVLVKQCKVPLPPKRHDSKKVLRNAHGACTNVVGSRFGEKETITALEAAGRLDITNDYRIWSLGNEKLSCASGVSIPEMESLKTRFIDWFAPNIAKDYFRSALRKDISRCILDVKASCDNGYNAWVLNKRAILNEPSQLKTQCERDKRQLANFDLAKHKALDKAVSKLETERRSLEQHLKSFDPHALMSFSDERTYCHD